MKNCVLVILILLMISCNSEKERDCTCNLDEIVTSKIDSTSIRKENIPFDIELEGKITPKIKRLIDAEISGTVNKSLKEVELNKVLEVVSNDMPEHNNIMLYFRMKKLIFCEYYERLCKDKSISDSELNKITNEKLNELDDAIDNYFNFKKDEEKPKPIMPKKIKKVENKEQIKFFIEPNNQELIRFIEKKTVFKYSKHSFKYKIKITNDGEFIPTNKSNTLYKYSGGSIEITLNDQRCYLFDDLRISETMSLGNPKRQLMDVIQTRMENTIDDNIRGIGNQIVLCLQ